MEKNEIQPTPQQKKKNQTKKKPCCTMTRTRDLLISNQVRIHSANLFLQWKKFIFHKILIKYHGLLSPPEIVSPETCCERSVNLYTV